MTLSNDEIKEIHMIPECRAETMPLHFGPDMLHSIADSS